MTPEGKFNPVTYRLNRGEPPAAPASAPPPRIERIVSGGQTGVDQAALDFAIERGIPHGGWCPRGRLAEDGLIQEGYALRETPEAKYPQRTEWNVRDSDGTVIFTDAPELTGGCRLTRRFAKALGKPWLHLSRQHDAAAAPRLLREFVEQHRIRVLNVAGPRLSTEPAARAFAMQVLETWWTGVA